MPHNVGVKNALENMKEVLALYKKVIGNYRPLLDGERYLTDKEVAHILKVSRRFFNFGCKTTVSFGIHRYAKCSSLRNKKRVTIWQPNSFTNPPQFAICPKLNFLILPLFAFILGRNALIFQKCFAFTSFFRNFVHDL